MICRKKTGAYCAISCKKGRTLTVRPLIICGDISFDFRIVRAGFYFGFVNRIGDILHKLRVVSICGNKFFKYSIIEIYL